ncbi:hypothetical protein Ocin01_14714 [Orchesella cincta]|uniref:Uncharacterized protein n=1 Tax=Orchesella cincta TaxID=48709 RepID=A0A1D2MG68_ORCCI|nr:hypothetical protein Ocin01_14714 [Orchesella cincta]
MSQKRAKGHTEPNNDFLRNLMMQMSEAATLSQTHALPEDVGPHFVDQNNFLLTHPDPSMVLHQGEDPPSSPSSRKAKDPPKKPRSKNQTPAQVQRRREQRNASYHRRKYAKASAKAKSPSGAENKVSKGITKGQRGKGGQNGKQIRRSKPA